MELSAEFGRKKVRKTHLDVSHDCEQAVEGLGNRLVPSPSENDKAPHHR